MWTQFRIAVCVFVLLTIVTGIVYPLLITLVAQAVFPHQANGSLIVDADGTILGSEIIGQPFDGPQYFWSRPSATTPPYNGASSGGSNLGPINPDLEKAVAGRVEALHAADPENKAPVPVDLVTTSASGLDPEISPAAAEYQVERVAKARGIDAKEVRKLVAQHTAGRTFGVLGEGRVNVLMLNRALDSQTAK
jgi:K+-transporting ATPase ATPase C chain